MHSLIACRVFKIYRPGQYVFLNFPSINFLEWHPFSVSSGPHEMTMECHIKVCSVKMKIYVVGTG